MMNITEFSQLLDAKGSDPNAWPAEQRYAAEDLLTSNPDAQELLRMQRRIDTLLGELPTPALDGLAARIAAQPLPPQRLPLADRVLNWLLPDQGVTALWRPLTAACLPLLFGVLMGNHFNFGISTESAVSEYWEDELAMISLTDYSENQVEP